MNSKIESGIYPGQAFFYGIALPFCFTAGKKKIQPMQVGENEIS